MHVCVCLRESQNERERVCESVGVSVCECVCVRVCVCVCVCVHACVYVSVQEIEREREYACVLKREREGGSEIVGHRESVCLSIYVVCVSTHVAARDVQSESRANPHRLADLSVCAWWDSRTLSQKRMRVVLCATGFPQVRS